MLLNRYVTPVTINQKQSSMAEGSTHQERQYELALSPKVLEISRAFQDEIVNLPPQTSINIAKSLTTLHDAWLDRVKQSAAYDKLPNYANTPFTILEANQTDYWVFSPNMKRAMARAIGTAFNTNITHYGCITGRKNYVCSVYLDTVCNGWKVEIHHLPPDETRETKISVVAYLPIPNLVNMQFSPRDGDSDLYSGKVVSATDLNYI